MGTKNYNLPLISGAESAKIPRDFNVLSTSVDELLKERFDKSDSNETALFSEVNLARTETVSINRIDDNSVPAQKLKTSNDQERIKLVNLSDEVIQAMAGNTPVNATPGIGSVTSEKIATKSVTKEKVSESKRATGKNLFSKTDYTANKLVVWNTGALADNTSYVTSGYIPVEASAEYGFSRVRALSYYDANKVFISGYDNVAYTSNIIRTSPASTAFIRVSLAGNDLDVMQVEKGQSITGYEEYLFELEGLVVSEKKLQSRLGMTRLRPDQVDGLSIGKNLFDKTTRSLGGYIAFSSGALIASASYDASDFIPVTPNETYTRSYSHQMAWYTKDRAYISGVNSGTSTIVAPSNAYYARLTMLKTGVDVFQFEKGAVSTTYEPYKITMSAAMVPDQGVIKKMMDGTTYSILNVAEVVKSKNLFDKMAVAPGKFVNYTNGSLNDSTIYAASDYIPVTPGSSYTRNYSHQIAFYSVDKAYISGIAQPSVLSSTTTVIAPANAKFMRTTVLATFVDAFMFNEGSVLAPYQAYEFNIKGLAIGKNRFDLFLPPEVCIAVGRTIELYNRQVCWVGNIKDYHFKWECPVGSSFKRKWSCTGVSGKIGEHVLKCTVYDNDMNIVTFGTTIVKIVDTTLATPKKLLCIGDSLSNKKVWMTELDNLTDSKIEFVGSRSWVTGGKILGHEGRSGFTAANYLEAATYSFEGEGVQPFWNPSTSSFDYTYYKAHTGVNPDAIQLFLGTNGIALDPTSNAGNIKTIVDKIRSVDATIPIYVVFTLFRGDQDGMGRQLSSDGYSAGSGVWKAEEDRKVYNLMVKLYELLGGYTNVRFIPIAHTHDSEYNFYNGTAYPVNPRSSITETQHSEATHPQTAGYQQMADIIYSVWCAYND